MHAPPLLKARDFAKHALLRIDRGARDFVRRARQAAAPRAAAEGSLGGCLERVGPCSASQSERYGLVVYKPLVNARAAAGPAAYDG